MKGKGPLLQTEKILTKADFIVEDLIVVICKYHVLFAFNMLRENSGLNTTYIAEIKSVC